MLAGETEHELSPQVAKGRAMLIPGRGASFGGGGYTHDQKRRKKKAVLIYFACEPYLDPSELMLLTEPSLSFDLCFVNAGCRDGRGVEPGGITSWLL